jgi:SPP1 gp7 family putative phage head morphogenesis protein
MAKQNQYSKFSNKRIAKKNTEAELWIGKQYATLYAETKLRMSELYATLGPNPTLDEARRYNRLSNLTTEIRKKYRALIGREITKTEMLASYNFTEKYFSEMWAAERSLGNFKWKNPTVEAIRASVYWEGSGMSMPQRFGKLYTQDVFNIESAITRGLATGSSFKKIAESIEDQFTKGFNDAIRVVRTEMTRNWSEGFNEAFKEMESRGLPIRKMWISAPDDRTRETHAQLDGQLSDEDGLFRIDGYEGEGPGLFGEPEMDINCRCTVSTVFTDEGEPLTGQALQDDWEKWSEELGRTDEGFAKARMV